MFKKLFELFTGSKNEDNFNDTKPAHGSDVK